MSAQEAAQSWYIFPGCGWTCGAQCKHRAEAAAELTRLRAMKREALNKVLAVEPGIRDKDGLMGWKLRNLVDTLKRILEGTNA